MQAVLNAALPIFALILTGFLGARFGGFERAATDAINRFAVYFALPALIFIAMAKLPDPDNKAFHDRLKHTPRSSVAWWKTAQQSRT
jgi:predicted permease